MIDAPQRISIPFHDQRTHGLKISRIRDGLIHIWHHIVDMFFIELLDILNYGHVT